MKYIYKKPTIAMSLEIKKNNIFSLKQCEKRKETTKLQKKRDVIDIDELINLDDEALLTGMLIW